MRADAQRAAVELLELVAIPEVGARVKAAEDAELRRLYARFLVRAMIVRDGSEP